MNRSPAPILLLAHPRQFGPTANTLCYQSTYIYIYIYIYIDTGTLSLMTVKSPLLRIACVRASRGVALKNPICEYYRQDLVDGRIRSGHVPLSLLPKWIPAAVDAMCGSLNVRASTAIGLEASWPREMKNKERCFIYISNNRAGRYFSWWLARKEIRCM